MGLGKPMREHDREDAEAVGTGGFVDRPFDGCVQGVAGAQGTVPSRGSVLYLSAAPSIMLVQVEPGDEPRELALAELPVRVLRVRYPLPACVRMLVMRPLAVIIGPAVVELDLAFLFRAAEVTEAATLQLGSGMARATLGSWLRSALAMMQSRRSALLLSEGVGTDR
jgi:hypothetical protein